MFVDQNASVGNADAPTNYGNSSDMQQKQFFFCVWTNDGVIPKQPPHNNDKTQNDDCWLVGVSDTEPVVSGFVLVLVDKLQYQQYVQSRMTMETCRGIRSSNEQTRTVAWLRWW